MDGNAIRFYKQSWLWTHILVFFIGWAVAAWVYVG